MDGGTSIESMEYEYANSQPPPHAHFGSLRSGRGCPALAGQRSWGPNRPEWHHDHTQAQRPWYPPHYFHHPPAFPSPSPQQQQQQQPWSPHGQTHHPASSESGPSTSTSTSTSTHPHDAGAPATSAYPHSVPASAPPSGSAPVHPLDPAPIRQLSPSSSEPLAEPRHMHATRSPDGDIRPIVPSPPVFSQLTPPSYPPGLGPDQREAHGSSRRTPVSNTSVRVRLPVPPSFGPATSESRSRHRILSYEPHRPVVPARTRAGSGGPGGNAAASPISSPDDDGDFDPAPRFQFLGYLSSARQSQILRGQMTNKRVASKKAIQSLQQVDLASLPDTEKTCVICYNDFGVASPEGTVEDPVRLPKCKHVFGNQCILKWLEDSYSCPYCRDKLDSELARPSDAVVQRMIAAVRADSDMPYLSQTSAIRRMMQNYRNDTALFSERTQASFRRHRDQDHTLGGGSSSRDGAARGERRAAPSEDPSDAQRRQRPRHEALPNSRIRSFDFSFAPLNSSSAPAPLDPAREPSSQRTPAWHHQYQHQHQHQHQHPHQQGEPLRMPMAPQVPSQPSFHFARAPPPSVSSFNPPIPFILPSLPHLAASGASPIPSMLSREDYYAAPSMIRQESGHPNYSNSLGVSASSAVASPSPEPLFPFGAPSSSAGITGGVPAFMQPITAGGYLHEHSPYAMNNNPPPPHLHAATPDRIGSLPNSLFYGP